MSILSLIEGARLLQINPSTLRERSAAGVIPGAKIGRAWGFIESDLFDYIRNQYRQPCPS